MSFALLHLWCARKMHISVEKGKQAQHRICMLYMRCLLCIGFDADVGAVMLYARLQHLICADE